MGDGVDGLKAFHWQKAVAFHWACDSAGMAARGRDCQSCVAQKWKWQQPRCWTWRKKMEGVPFWVLAKEESGEDPHKVTQLVPVFKGPDPVAEHCPTECIRKIIFTYLSTFSSINEAIPFCFGAASLQHNRLKTLKWTRKSRAHPRGILSQM